MDGIENLAPFFVDVFTKAREIIEFSVAVPTLGEALLRPSAYRTGGLAD